MHEFVLILFLYFAKSCLLSNWRKMSDERETDGVAGSIGGRVRVGWGAKNISFVPP